MALLTENTPVKTTIGVGLLVISTCVWGTWKIAGILQAINESQIAIKADLNELIRQQRDVATTWALRLAIENPSIRVPDPQDPSKVVGK